MRSGLLGCKLYFKKSESLKKFNQFEQVEKFGT